MENIEKGYTGRNMYFLSDIQINFKLVWECHQTLVKLAEHNRFQLVWVPRHMGINGNEITDKLARQGSSHPIIGPEPVRGVSTKVAIGVIRD
jgi:ribonuclease HI